MTVYVFDKDAGGTPTCYDDCGKKWPPYLARSSAKMGEGWATVKRKDGSLQWTYDGKPLYFYSADKKKGDKTGDARGVGGQEALGRSRRREHFIFRSRRRTGWCEFLCALRRPARLAITWAAAGRKSAQLIR
jgi:hypothetical protein